MTEYLAKFYGRILERTLTCPYIDADHPYATH